MADTADHHDHVCWSPLALDVMAVTVAESLAQYRWEDAIFLAERLHVEAGTVESSYLLATCYYRSGHKQQAKHLLTLTSSSSSSSSSSRECDLLFARCCLELGDCRTGLARLGGLLCTNPCSEEDIVSRYGDLAAEAFWLIGKLNKSIRQDKEAARYFRLSLKYNPFMWSSYQSLCAMAESKSPDEVFDISNLPRALGIKAGVIQGNAPHAISMAAKKHAELTSEHHQSACFITPDMFANPKLGKAVASSTPFLHGVSVFGIRANKDGGGSDLPRGNLMESEALCRPSHRESSPIGTLADCPQQTLSYTPSPTPVSSGMLFGASSSATVQSTGRPKLPQPTGRCHPLSSQHQAPLHDTAAPTSPSRSQVMPPPSTGPTQLRRSARLGRVARPTSSPPRHHVAEVVRKRRLKSPVGKAANAKTSIKKQRTSFTPSLSANCPTASPVHKTHPPGSIASSHTQYQDSENTPVGVATPENKDSGHLIKTDTSEPTASHNNLLLAVTREIVPVLKQIATAYRCLLRYDLEEAVSTFKSLPVKHYNTPWVLTCVAQALIAGEHFKQAAGLFESVHKMDPYRHEGMELYSAALWHLRRETQLSLLVEDLHSSNHCTHEALCAMASLMNLYKDHDSAIRFLERAIQCNPQFVYAHSLLGLEYTLTKHYDKALEAFQSAVSIDPRHFNAWFGMAHLYSQQEKLKLAEVCSRRALAINRSSSIACTQLAIVLQQQGRLEEALAAADQATTINTTNCLPQYHRASILSCLGRAKEALKQLEQVTSVVPKEPSFYRAMGNILMQLGRPHEAVLHMAWAKDLAYSSGGDDVGAAFLPLDYMEQLDDKDFVPLADAGEDSM